MTGKAARIPVSRLAREMAAAARTLKAELRDRRSQAAHVSARESLAADLGRDVPPDEAADALAQAIVCAAAILGRRSLPDALRWLAETSSPWESLVLRTAAATGTEYSVLTPYEQSPAHVYDQFLYHYAPTSRRRHGVFFTPQPIAEYIVGQVDHLLCDEFGLADGLATQSAIRNPKSEIVLLDPACGTGVFLLAVIDHLHRRLGEQWNEFVPDLLPRLVGIELLPVPALLAKLNLAAKLAETGYEFRHPDRLQIHTGDALIPNPQSKIQNPKSALPVVLGNPPFSSLTTNTNPWIARLVRGDAAIRGYMQAGDLRLGERKTWLHDDYVKFLRLAQWYVEEAGRGVVGMITSRGYLDNATFRLMRHELMRAFPHIRVVDLHGSRKASDMAPDGRPDENVFGLDQGVAIALLARSGNQPDRRVEYAELWGARREKLAALKSGGRCPGAISFRSLAPTDQHWRLVPTPDDTHAEYATAWSLAEAMPVSTPAPVTARDHFVVAFTRQELHERIAEFCDLAIPDEAIRRRYFTRTRSSRYPQGNTRSWKLAEARRRVAADEHWPGKIVRCLYRPFDWRYVFWHPAMIDWPRSAVTRHLTQEPGYCGLRIADCGFHESSIRNPKSEIRNLCLIARRQQLPTQPCTFFWIASGLALDGVIRSDNRGSESLFPLWLAGGEQPGRANFAPAFVEQTAASIDLAPSPEDLLAYIYSLFHSPGYRERYAAPLRLDFPRVLLPRTATLFVQLASLGRRLIDLHLLDNGVGSLWPKTAFTNGRSVAAKDSRPPEQEFRVGGYVVLTKWLQPKHRSARDPQFHSIASAIAETQRLMAAIDAAIAGQGGFPMAFASGGRESLAEIGDP